MHSQDQNWINDFGVEVIWHKSSANDITVVSDVTKDVPGLQWKLHDCALDA